jgi:hypothetical protein
MDIRGGNFGGNSQNGDSENPIKLAKSAILSIPVPAPEPLPLSSQELQTVELKPEEFPKIHSHAIPYRPLKANTVVGNCAGNEATSRLRMPLSDTAVRNARAREQLADGLKQL